MTCDCDSGSGLYWESHVHQESSAWEQICNKEWTTGNSVAVAVFESTYWHTTHTKFQGDFHWNVVRVVCRVYAFKHSQWEKVHVTTEPQKGVDLWRWTWFRNTSCGQWRDPPPRTRPCWSTSAGKWRGKPGWSLRSRQSTYALGERSSVGGAGLGQLRKYPYIIQCLYMQAQVNIGAMWQSCDANQQTIKTPDNVVYTPTKVASVKVRKV